jgi:hypothetical protein
MRSPFMSSYYGCRMMIQNLPDALLFVERTTLIIDRHAHAVDEASNDATGRKGVVAQLGCIEQPDGNGFRQVAGSASGSVTPGGASCAIASRSRCVSSTSCAARARTAGSAVISG